MVAAHEAARARIAEILRTTRRRLTAGNPDSDGDLDTPNYGAAFDGDGDGLITVTDIMRVAAQWSRPCP